MIEKSEKTLRERERKIKVYVPVQIFFELIHGNGKKYI